MIEIGLFAFLCALCTLYLIAPIAISRKKTSYLLIFFIPAISLGIYILKGSPGQTSQAVMFDQNTERKAMRAIVTEELKALKTFHENPDNKQALMHLASMQIAQGKFEEATSYLKNGLNKWENDKDLMLQLSAAHFAYGLLLVEQNQNMLALKSLYHAQSTAPPKAPFSEDLNMFVQELEKMNNKE